ncbi:scavenger receptor class F member 2-like [Crassostrea angulata]|uniref:scavenger receptor class F member 2-like n=1 Tax=Magallana angulata TaxID=2784310 RepID=UPI0022B21781|nr:scavenger receptor class F member 2-like [Crassostrea angulata]
MFSLFKYSLIVFLNIVHTSMGLHGACSNGSDGSPLECCENYRAVGNSCEECWPGTHGVDCRNDCPPNFYGRLCLEKCGCEPCDRVIGCSITTDTSSKKSASGEDESSTNSSTWLTLSVLASCFVICFIFSLRIFCIIR